VISFLRFGRRRFRQSAAGYIAPTLIWLGGHSLGGALTTSGTVAGDFAIGIDTDSDTSVPAAPPTDCTAIGAGVASDEGNDCAILASAKFLSGADEGVAANGASRRVWAVFRDVDPGMLSLLTDGVTYAYSAASGSNMIVPALAPPRSAIILTAGRRTGTADTDFATTLLRRQDSASAPAQLYWTGPSNTLGVQGTPQGSFAGESPSIVSTVGRCAFSFALLGAPQ
jgi:hypothetical protein